MTAEITLCIPVLRRYDLLRELLLSLRSSTVLPSEVQIIDNGRSYDQVVAAIDETIDTHFEISIPAKPLGVAESWNAFIHRTERHRIIANDDMLFAPQSLERLLATCGDLVLGFGFSCFLLRDTCIQKIGFFDETISPGYAYFEDCDYMQRVHRECDAGRYVFLSNAEGTGLIHGRADEGSQTYRAGTPAEVAEHWRKFTVAKNNFVRKWGAEPHILEQRRMAVAQ